MDQQLENLEARHPAQLQEPDDMDASPWEHQRDTLEVGTDKVLEDRDTVAAERQRGSLEAGTDMDTLAVEQQRGTLEVGQLGLLAQLHQFALVRY